MAHDAEFLLEFDPERFIRQGLTDQDFFDLGFTQAELDVVGMRRLSMRHLCVDYGGQPNFDWQGYRWSIEESMGKEAMYAAEPIIPRTEDMRVSEPIYFMHVEPSVVDKMIRDMHPEWLADGTDFKYQTARAILWDTGVVEVSNITLIRCVGDNPLVHKTLEISKSFLPYYATGNVTVVEPWDEPVRHTLQSTGMQHHIEAILGFEVQASENGLEGMVAELSRRSGLSLNHKVFSEQVVGQQHYVVLTKPSPIHGMILIKR